MPAARPREEFHQFLIGVFREYDIPSCLHSYMQVLRDPALYRGPGRPVVSDAMLRGVWTRLRDRLSSLDSSSTMVEVISADATLFIDMYVDKHTGKHIRRQVQDIASDFAFSAPRSHSSRGMQHII